jgi:hypothetical protein
MDPAVRPSSAESNERLMKELERVLGAGMGARLPFIGPMRQGKPIWWALGWLLVYSLACAAVTGVDPSRQPKLFSLLVWGGLYFTVALYFALSATSQVLETIRSAVLPFASPAYVDAVRANLSRRYGAAQLIFLPLLVAMLCLAAALWAIGELPGVPASLDAGLRSPEMLFWAATYFLYFLGAAMSAIASRFYRSFADHLELESESFYVLGAADTPLVRGLARLANQVLTFLAFIFLLVASAMLLAVVPKDSYSLEPESRLLLLMVPSTCFVCLGIGSLVYLGTEAAIRRTLQGFTLRQAATVEREGNRLFHSRGTIGPEKAGELDQLARLHDRIVAGGRYGSRLGAAISITLPLAMPLLSLVIKLWESLPPFTR